MRLSKLDNKGYLVFARDKEETPIADLYALLSKGVVLIGRIANTFVSPVVVSPIIINNNSAVLTEIVLIDKILYLNRELALLDLYRNKVY